MSKNPEFAIFVNTDDDGWTLPCYFARRPGIHPDIRFDRRPFTPGERAVLMQGINDAKGEKEVAELISQAITKSVKKWDLPFRDKDEDATAPINVDFVSRLRFEIWDRMANVIVFQTDAGDIDPEWDKEEAASHNQAQLEALLDKTATTEQTKVGNLEGNS